MTKPTSTGDGGASAIACYKQWYMAKYRGIKVEVRKIEDGTATIYPNTGKPMRDLYCNTVRVPVTELEEVTK